MRKPYFAGPSPNREKWSGQALSLDGGDRRGVEGEGLAATVSGCVLPIKIF